MTREREGVLFCIVAACGYSVTTLFAKLGYASGANVVTLLMMRYCIAALFFWVLILRSGRGLPPRSTITRGLLLGAIAQAGQTWLFGNALIRINASLTILLLYAYPAMVTVGAVLLGRERLNAQRVVALLVAPAGAALVVSGPQEGKRDVLGIALALGAAFVYTCTLLTGHAILRAAPPMTLAGLVATGAALSLSTVGLVSGGLRFDFAPWGWLPIIGLALFASILATVCNYSGMTRIGPTVASILGTLEIPLGVLWAVLFLSERLFPLQIAGGLCVLSAVLLLQWRRARPQAARSSAAPVDDPEGNTTPSPVP